MIRQFRLFSQLDNIDNIDNLDNLDNLDKMLRPFSKHCVIEIRVFSTNQGLKVIFTGKRSNF
jgi:hypothetical protein